MSKVNQGIIELDADTRRRLDAIKRRRELYREEYHIRTKANLVAHLRTYREVRLGTPCEKLDDWQMGLPVFRREDLERLTDVARLDGDLLIYTGPPAPPRVVLVGENNPYSERPQFDLYDDPPGSAGGRLRRVILGVSRATYHGPDVHRANLCRRFWSAPRAREEAARLARLHPQDAVFVLLGKKVQQAFGLYQHEGDAPFRVVRGPREGGGTRLVALLPHPSGRCRHWNAPGAIARAREVLVEAGVRLPLGEAS